MNKIDELKKVMNYEKEYLNLTSSQANMRINLAINETVKVVADKVRMKEEDIKCSSEAIDMEQRGYNIAVQRLNQKLKELGV